MEKRIKRERGEEGEDGGGGRVKDSSSSVLQLFNLFDFLSRQPLLQLRGEKQNKRLLRGPHLALSSGILL